VNRRASKRDERAAGRPELGDVEVGVLTVDDQAVFRRVARDVIEATAGFEPVGEASSGEEAVTIVDQIHPELVLVDVRMPGMDGIETARRISEADPTTTVVLISIQDPEEVASAPESCGAVALVRKQDFGPALLKALWGEHGRRPRRAANLG
jgi:two-component system, NarL family, invasion response regulator UvrY